MPNNQKQAQGGGQRSGQGGQGGKGGLSDNKGSGGSGQKQGGKTR